MNNSEEHIKWKKVWTAPDEIEAQLVKNLMEIEEIPVQLLHVGSSNLFPDTSIIDIGILVPVEDAEKALSLIQENFEDN